MEIRRLKEVIIPPVKSTATGSIIHLTGRSALKDLLKMVLKMENGQNIYFLIMMTILTAMYPIV